MRQQISVKEMETTESKTNYIISELNIKCDKCRNLDEVELKFNLFCLEVARKLNYYYYYDIENNIKTFHFNEKLTIEITIENSIKAVTL